MHKYISFKIAIEISFHVGKQCTMARVSDVQVDFKMQTVTDVLDGSDDPEVDDHLYVVAVVDCWVEVGDDEVGVVGQPAHQEDGHHSHHHLHHLGFIITTNITIITTIIIISRRRASVPIIIFDTCVSI